MNFSVGTFVAKTIAMSLVSMTGLCIMVSSMEGLKKVQAARIHLDSTSLSRFL